MKQRGYGMSEWIVVAALLFISAIATDLYFGHAVSNVADGMGAAQAVGANDDRIASDSRESAKH